MRATRLLLLAWTVLACCASLACESTPARTPMPPSLEQALAGLPKRSALVARLATSAGVIRCQLAPAHAPRAVAMFVGLARGTATWREPRSRAWVQRPLYRDLPFFRAIAGVLIQSGCPIGNGTGSPGYRLPVEAHGDDKALLSQPGALLLARYQPAPNRADPEPPPPGHVIGSQFVITLADMSHLEGRVSVIGACADHDVISRIAQRVASGARERLKEVSFAPAGND